MRSRRSRLTTPSRRGCLRLYEPRAAEAAAALFARINALEPSFAPFDLARWRAFRMLPELEDGRRFHVVDRDDRIVGLSTLRAFTDRRAGGLVWRVRIFVDPSEWRRGIGRSL